jgi:hypothetical protein
MNKHCSAPYSISMAAIAAIALLGSPLCQAQSAPDTGSAEQVLEALKHALVNAAIEETVQVHSSAYIDGSGQLIESSYFDTTARVRGVRVMEYLPVSEQPLAPTAILPPSLHDARSGVCAVRAPNSYRPTLLVTAALELGQGRVNSSMTPALVAQTRQLLDSQALLNANWLLIHDDPSVAQMSAYDRLLTGKQPFEQADYELHWSLAQVPAGQGEPVARRTLRQSTELATGAARYLIAQNPVAPASVPARSPAVTLHYRLDLIRRHAGEVVHSRQFSVTVPAADTTLRAGPAAEQHLLNALVPQLHGFVAELATEHACTLRQFALTPAADGSPDELRIMLGQQNQARPGDRFLLLETPWEGGQQTLNTTLVASLSIGEIVAVDRFQARIKIIAGNGASHQLKYAVPF